MKKIILFAVLATGLTMPLAQAQDMKDIERQLAETVERLTKEKERIISYEKERLKMKIEELDALVAKDSLTAEEAQKRKEGAARIAAKNIDNKTAIVDNQIALVQRGENFTPPTPHGENYFAIGLGNAYDDNGSAFLGIEYRASGRKVRYDKRTFTNIVVSGGISNTVRSDGGGSPYVTWKSAFAEFGFTWRTRLRKDDNFFRLAYGLSFQINQLTPADDRYFVDDYAGHTSLQPFGNHLKWNRMYFTNLVLPVFLEFGPSKKVTYPDRFRYLTGDKFKAGVGVFGGFNIRTAQWLKWKEGNNTRQEKIIEDYNAQNLVYGVAAYAGIGPLSLYAKYDLNPLFRNAAVREHLVTVALRVDL